MTRDEGGLRVGEVDVADWRWVLGRLRACFATAWFPAGAAFVGEVAQWAEAQAAEVELGPEYVRFALHSPGAGVTERDVRLAERISALAAERGLVARPERIQVLEIALDTAAPAAVSPFWGAVLAATAADEQDIDPADGFPALWFQRSDSTAPDRQRFHLDITVPPEVAEERIAAAVAAGGRIVDAGSAPAFVVLADPDGNQVCVCTELGRD